MVGFNTSREGSSPELVASPGVFGFQNPNAGDSSADKGTPSFFRARGLGFERSKDLATKAQSLIEAALPGLVGREPVPTFIQREQFAQNNGDFSNAFANAVLRPKFGATTSSEQALLDQLQSQTNAASATRGLGPASQTELARSLAPALISMRQTDIQNFAQGAKQDRLANELQNQFALQQRGQDIAQNKLAATLGLAQRQQDIAQRANIVDEIQMKIENLLALANQAAPQSQLGQTSFGRSKGGQISGKGVAAGLGGLKDFIK